jgi:hypothetical protein
MEEHIVYYLNLISKLSDILNYIESNFKEDDITSYIKECKSVCIDKVKSEPLITAFLKEIHEEIHEELPKSDNLETTNIQNNKNTVDLEMQETVNTLSNLIKSDTDTDNINPDMLDSFGNGLVRLLRDTPQTSPDIKAPQTSPTIKIPQIKNELKFINTNINCQIKKKNEY